MKPKPGQDTKLLSNRLPYARHSIDERDVQAVVDALRSDWLTTGPKVSELEANFAQTVGAAESVAVSSGTAALHTAINALGIGPGDEVIVSSMTFAASANCVVYQGGTPVFCDVTPDTLVMDPTQVERLITNRTKAIVAVDFAGHPCDYDALKILCKKFDLRLLADACHSLGALYKGINVGILADVSAFSLHPVKHITAGEGGLVTTDSTDIASRMRAFRNHGIDVDSQQREKGQTWVYDMQDLGFNYRLTDFQSALASSQLQRLPENLKFRRQIAALYDEALEGLEWVVPLDRSNDVSHAYHLYVVRIKNTGSGARREEIFSYMRSREIMVNVHYIPVHLLSYYQAEFDVGPGLCPVAEAAYEEMLSLPIFPAMQATDVERVVETLKHARKAVD